MTKKRTLGGQDVVTDLKVVFWGCHSYFELKAKLPGTGCGSYLGLLHIFTLLAHLTNRWPAFIRASCPWYGVGRRPQKNM